MPHDILVVSVFAWIGWLVSTGVLLFLYGASGYLGVQVFKRLKRLYALHVIGYWLRRFEQEGKRTFERPSGD